MFKKLLVSTVLGFLLFTSLTSISAPEKKDTNKEEPILVAKIDVNNQLSISEHQIGEANFINQVGDLKTNEKSKDGVAMSVVSVFWTMAFGLFIFVIRVTARRIK